MTHHRTLLRLIAALAVAGTMAVGTVAPASAAPTHQSYSGHQMRPADTGWNGT
jgi:hypothetical protein